MLALTTYSWKLADAVLRGEPIDLPTNGLDIALHHFAPNADCDNDELVELGYVRLHIDTTSWAPSVEGLCDLLTQIDWPQAGEDWGEVAAISMWDGANPWFRALLATPRVVVSGSTFHLAAEDLKGGFQ